MSKVITFSRVFPSYHPRKGEPTYFVEKIYKSLDLPRFDSNGVRVLKHDVFNFADYGRCEPKHHTIRAGHRFKVGDWFRPVVWGNDINPKSGRSGPYHSKQITFAPDIQIKKVWDFKMYIINEKENGHGIYIAIENKMQNISTQIHTNDGLSFKDFCDWFCPPGKKFITGLPIFYGQIICWNENINY